MYRPPESPIENVIAEVRQLIRNFLDQKITFENVKTSIELAKQEYLNSVKKVTGTKISNRSLIPVEQALLTGCKIRDASGEEVTSFQTLFARLERIKNNQQYHGANTISHQNTIETLGFTDATTETKALGIHIKQLQELILPEDNIGIPVGSGTGNGEKKERVRGFNKVRPLFEALEQEFKIEKTDSSECFGLTGKIESQGFRRQSYVAFIFPKLTITILVNNLYGQGVYILPGCVDEKVLTSITKQGRKNMKESENNPQNFIAYFVADPVHHERNLQERKNQVIEKIYFAQQAATTTIEYTKIPTHSPEKVSAEEQKKIFMKRFEEQTYDKLMGLTRNQVTALTINIGGYEYHILYIAALLGNKNEERDPRTIRGFQNFITELFEKPQLKQVITDWLKDMTYEKLMDFGEKEITDLKLSIGGMTMSISQMASMLGNDNKTCNPKNSPTNFRKFIHFIVFQKTQKEYDQKFPPLSDQKEIYIKWLKEETYEKLMSLTAIEARALKTPGGVGMNHLATILGNNNSTNDLANVWNFRGFIHFKIFEKTQEEFDLWVESNRNPNDYWILKNTHENE